MKVFARWLSIVKSALVKIKFLIYFISILSITFLYQNCSQKSFEMSVETLEDDSDVDVFYDQDKRSVAATSSSDTDSNSNEKINLRCFIDADRTCTPLTVHPLKSQVWAPLHVQKRHELFMSKAVQESEEGCNNFAKLIKTECLNPAPVTAVFYNQENVIQNTEIVVGFDVDLPQKKEGLDILFKKYFANCDKNFTVEEHYEDGQCIKNDFHLESNKLVSDYLPCSPTDAESDPNALNYGYVWNSEKKEMDKSYCRPLECRSDFTLVADINQRWSCKVHFKFVDKGKWSKAQGMGKNKDGPYKANYFYYQNTIDYKFTESAKIIAVGINYTTPADKYFPVPFFYTIPVGKDLKLYVSGSVDKFREKHMFFTPIKISSIPFQGPANNTIKCSLKAKPGQFCKNKNSKTEVPALCPAGSFCRKGIKKTCGAGKFSVEGDDICQKCTNAPKGKKVKYSKGNTSSKCVFK